jgi:hypothetical protein
MARITKKYMLEDYPRLERKAGLLDLFMHDTLTGRKPDADVTVGEFRALMYRCTGANGGYVAWNILGNTYIEYLDDAIARVPRDEAYPDRRSVVAKLQAVRYRLLNQARVA